MTYKVIYSSPREKEEKSSVDVDPVAELQSQCRSNMTRSIVRTIFKPDLPKCNELFFPGRMAYIIDLEEDLVESDIPTTTIRSKADVEAAGGTITSQATLSTNDIVINKLTQILSYLRAGTRNKKKKKLDKLMMEKEMKETMEKEAAASEAARNANMPIYDDVGSYVPDSGGRSRDSRRDRDRDRDRDRGRRDDRGRRGDRRRDDDYDRRRGDHRERGDGGEKRSSYFEKSADDDRGVDDEHRGGLSHKDRD